MSKNSERLVKYIRSLKEFKLISQPNEFQYENFGAVIIDCILQAGLNYKNVVEPRIKTYLSKFSEKKKLIDFKKFLEGDVSMEILRFKNKEKLERMSRLVRFFEKEGLNTVEDLRKWLSIEGNNLKLKSIKGIGPKTADYICMLVGLQAIAVDVNLIKFLNSAGINLTVNDYYEAREVIKEAADNLKIQPSVLDFSIWSYVSNKK